MVAASISNREFAEANFKSILWRERITLLLAWIVAFVFHFGQKRRSGGWAIEHPMAVANALRQFGLKAQIVGLFHDILEDIPVWSRPLAVRVISWSGTDILEMVSALTNWTNDDGEYFRQMALAIRRYPLILLVKLADKSNVLNTPFYKPAKEELKYLRKTYDYFYPFVLVERKRLPRDIQNWCNDQLAEIVALIKIRSEKLEKELKASPPGGA